MNYGDKIGKGVWVRVRTTNGGVIVRRTLETYRHTYDICLEQWLNEPGKFYGYIIIPCWRIKSVELVAADDPLNDYVR